LGKVTGGGGVAHGRRVFFYDLYTVDYMLTNTWPLLKRQFSSSVFIFSVLFVLSFILTYLDFSCFLKLMRSEKI
jgi:hypothetical protein